MIRQDSSRTPFSVSVIENTAHNGRLTKVHKFDTQKGLRTEADAVLTNGTVTVEVFDSLRAFMDRRSGLAPSQALMMGLPIYPDARIVTQKALRDIPIERRQKERIIARDRAHVWWAAGPAVVMLDLDSPDRFPPKLNHLANASPEDWREFLITLVPGLNDVPMSWAPSSSSYLYNGSEELVGRRGQRFYFIIDAGVDTIRFKEALRLAMIRQDSAWYDVSKSGSLLERYPFDLAVYQPERLDFAAEPICEPPIERRPPEPLFWNEGGPCFSASSLPDESKQSLRVIKNKLQEERSAKADEARQIREAWIEQTGRRIALVRPNVEPAVATAVARNAVVREVLLGDFMLLDSEGKEVSVRELLQDPRHHEGRRFHDPLEPDYRDDPRIAVFMLNHAGRPLIYSHAHGGQSFRCQEKAISVAVGTMDETADNLTVALEQDTADLYLNGSAIVGVDEGTARMLSLEADGLALRLHRRFDVVKVAANGRPSPTDLPARHVKAFMQVSHELPLPHLAAVVGGPFARADGGIVDVPGYDAASEVLYLSPSSSPPTVRHKLGVPEAEEALKYLWYPFSNFPFVTDLDRGALLAAVLSGVIRQSIELAPGYLFTATTAGTGKTLLAQCVGAFQTRTRPAASSRPSNDDEVRKHIFADLRYGQTYLLYDNAERGSEIDSPALAALITSAEITDRVLGGSHVETRLNRMTVALTGNNISLRGDLNRRILPIALDAGVERPWERHFPFLPMEFILANWISLRIAALELIGAWKADGARRAEGSMGFPEWDSVVRSTLAWIISHLDVGVGFGDPKDAIKKAYEADPEAEPLGNLLTALHEVFGDEEFQLKDVEDRLQPSGESLFDDMGDEAGLSGPTPEQILKEARDAALGHVRSYGDTRAALGRYLAQHDGRVMGGLRLDKGGTKGGSRRWRVSAVPSVAGSSGMPDGRCDNV